MNTAGIIAIGILVWIVATVAWVALVELAIGVSQRYFKRRRSRYPSWTRYG